MNELTVRHVTKQFGNLIAVNDVSFTMKSGIYGLIGPNGAGKSTLIKLLSTLLKQNSGDILYNGQDIVKLGKEYRSLIGVMPQNQKGYENFSANQFLYYMATLKNISKQEADKRIKQLALQVGLENDLDKKIKTYSGGMRQRLMFIQALLNDPKILILDEPTAGLDPYERIRLRNYISSISENKIIIIATHVMQDIETIANGIMFLNKGKLIYNGDTIHLMQQLQGKMFEAYVLDNELEVFQNKYKITSSIRTEKGIYIRYIDKDANTANEVVPSLEDAYLYYFNQ